MFQFGGFPAFGYVFTKRSHTSNMRGFPIRTSADLTPICGSPRLFAAYRVLLRLLTPRHSPYALFSLNYFEFVSSFLCAVTPLISCKLIYAGLDDFPSHTPPSSFTLLRLHYSYMILRIPQYTKLTRLFPAKFFLHLLFNRKTLCICKRTIGTLTLLFPRYSIFSFLFSFQCAFAFLTSCMLFQ